MFGNEGVIQDNEKSFFQVTINSQKLRQLIEEFKNRFETSDRKSQLLENLIHENRQSFEARLKKIEEKNEYRMREVEKNMNSNYEMQVYYLQKFEKQMNQKMGDANENIGKVSVQIIRSQQQSKTDFLSYLKKTKTDIMGGQDLFIPSVKEVIHTMEMKLKSLKSEVPVLFETLYNNKQGDKIDATRKKNKEVIDLCLRGNEIEEQEKENQKNRVLYPSHNFSNTQSSQLKTSDETRKRKKKLNSMRPSSNNEALQGKRQSLDSKRYEDLVKSMEKVQEKLKNKETEIQKIKYKNLVIDEKFVYLTKKLEKYHIESTQIRNGLRRIESDKTDEKVIEQIRGSIKSISREIQQKLQKKCSKQDFLKDKVRVNEKLSILHENMIQKADKGQIQKAIIFLQGKIKQIIFLVAADHSDQRDGAVIKSAVKCLSCDRDLQKNLKKVEKQPKINSRNEQNIRNTLTVRAVTNRMNYRVQAKRVKTIGNNIEGSCWNNDGF